MDEAIKSTREAGKPALRWRLSHGREVVIQDAPPDGPAGVVYLLAQALTSLTPPPMRPEEGLQRFLDTLEHGVLGAYLDEVLPPPTKLPKPLTCQIDIITEREGANRRQAVVVVLERGGSKSDLWVAVAEAMVVFVKYVGLDVRETMALVLANMPEGDLLFEGEAQDAADVAVPETDGWADPAAMFRSKGGAA